MGNLESLFHKKLTDQLTSTEKDYLNNNWDELEQDFAQTKEIWESVKNAPEVRFDHTKAYAKFAAITQAPAEQHAVEQEPSRGRILNLRNTMYAVAAAVAMAFFAFNLLFKSNAVSYQTDSNSMVVNLPDGSKIDLAPKSTLTFDKKTFAQSRKVDLNGEALFDVAKLGTPFDIDANGFDVKVLGTTFLVSKSSVQVLEGKVEVSTPTGKVQITDRQAIDINSDKISEIRSTNFNQQTWLDVQMKYDNEPLSRVISDIESKYKIEITNSKKIDLSVCKLTSSSLNGKDLNLVIHVLESAVGLKLSKQSSGYNIESISCK